MLPRAPVAYLLILLLGVTYLPSVQAADQDVFRYSSQPKGKHRDVDLYYGCSAIAPIDLSCSTGNHTWREAARLGILFSCPTCAFDGVVTARIIHARGTLEFSCHLHSVPMATTGSCWTAGTPPKDKETIEHQCVATAVSVGRYMCSFATFAEPPQPPTPPQ